MSKERAKPTGQKRGSFFKNRRKESSAQEDQKQEPRLSNDSQGGSRRSSAEKTPRRYELPSRSQGPQQSHAVQNLVEKSKHKTKDKKLDQRRQKLARESKTKLDQDKDHHDAVDWYFKSTGYQRESIEDLRKTHGTLKKLSNLFLHRQCAKEEQQHHHVRRCKKCLEELDNCDCERIHQKTIQSDWMTLIRPKDEDVKTFTKQRLDWFTKLEENSKFDYQKIASKKFNADREICCFPFKTFRCFSRHDIKTMDFYMKADSNKTPDTTR
jgi:hypothetical protein